MPLTSSKSKSNLLPACLWKVGSSNKVPACVWHARRRTGDSFSTGINTKLHQINLLSESTFDFRQYIFYWVGEWFLRFGLEIIVLGLLHCNLLFQGLTCITKYLFLTNQNKFNWMILEKRKLKETENIVVMQSHKITQIMIWKK